MNRLFSLILVVGIGLTNFGLVQAQNVTSTSNSPSQVAVCYFTYAKDGQERYGRLLQDAGKLTIDRCIELVQSTLKKKAVETAAQLSYQYFADVTGPELKGPGYMLKGVIFVGQGPNDIELEVEELQGESLE